MKPGLPEESVLYWGFAHCRVLHNTTGFSPGAEVLLRSSIVLINRI